MFFFYWSFEDESRDSAMGVADDPCKDKKYSERAIDVLRVQKDEVSVITR